MSGVPARSRATSLPALAGALTLAVAAPVVATATPAHAVSGSVWERLAQCESGGDWQYGGPGGHVDAGYAQYEGGLNFAPGTWLAYRLPGYPRHAWAASKAQQIAVAERVLADQGWSAWPACSRKLGLHGTASPTSTSVPSHHTRSDHSRSDKARHHSGHAAKRYLVRPGDTLSRIAAKFHVRGGWRALYRENRATIGHNPNVILPGQRLRVR